MKIVRLKRGGKFKDARLKVQNKREVEVLWSVLFQVYEPLQRKMET
jgi:hypothetical protein